MVKYTFTDTLAVDEYQTLRKSVGWPTLPNDEAQSGLEHSSFICSCHLEDTIVGCVRLIWDHGYIAYFSDLMVEPEHQRKGIGKELAQRAIKWIKLKKPQSWKIKIVLISTTGNEGFYRKLGFKQHPSDNMGSGMDLWLY